VLAWQHAQTFRARFAKLPVKISLLSRVQSDAEQKNIILELKNGEVDIVIATHRLLQKDVEFKNLGLLIIDEEQRFGVKQKEKLKSMRINIDVLSLSATPIPRTLYFSLAGLKNISNIGTPPPNRLPIKTYVAPRSKKTMREAILAELARGGQVYYLHNRISTIESARVKIASLAQEGARIAVAHAKLPDSQLIEIIDDFRNKKFDILIATTIIENGLDLSNVNTLIVEDASRLGLAQAHQLRGRIGRGEKQAFAYFLYSPKRLTEVGKRRLETLQRYQDLGAGYEIAKRDLEIRGAGNILGREQHGSINRVGLNLYCQMLNEAVEELKTGS
jgi:transcription-repair coupling factor (superfamily II helicase)